MTTDVADDPVVPQPVATRRRPSVDTLAQLAVVLGGVAVGVSLALHWVDFESGSAGLGGAHLSAIDVPLKFLVDSKKLVLADGPSVLLVLIPAVVVGMVGAVLHIKTLVFVAAGVALVVPAMFVYQLRLAIDASNHSLVAGLRYSLSDYLGVGVFACAGGAIAMIAGCWFLRRRTSVTAVR